MTAEAFTEARIDHVAVATADLAAAQKRWIAIGAAPVAGADLRTFAFEQVRTGTGAKIELISTSAHPPAGGSFIDAFLARFGGGTIHHVTIKVPSLPAAADAVAEAGLEVIDYDDSEPTWMEFFLRPSQVGGLVAQVAQASQSDAEWARSIGRDVHPTPGSDAPALHAVRLTSTDLTASREVWTLLGARVAPLAGPHDGIRARWADAPLALEIVPTPPGGRAEPVGLVMTGMPSTERSEVQPPILPPLPA